MHFTGFLGRPAAPPSFMHAALIHFVQNCGAFMRRDSLRSLTFGAPSVHRLPLRDDGARSRRPFLTWQPPGCPLKFALRPTRFPGFAPARAWGFLRSPPPGWETCIAAAAHNRFHPWRVGSGGKPPSNIERRLFERRFEN